MTTRYRRIFDTYRYVLKNKIAFIWSFNLILIAKFLCNFKSAWNSKVPYKKRQCSSSYSLYKLGLIRATYAAGGKSNNKEKRFFENKTITLITYPQVINCLFPTYAQTNYLRSLGWDHNVYLATQQLQTDKAKLFFMNTLWCGDDYKK